MSFPIFITKAIPERQVYMKTYCTNCRKEINRKPSKINNGNNFCCKECEQLFRKGKSKGKSKSNDIIIIGDYSILKINNNLVGPTDIIIDTEDIDKIKQYYWNLRVDRRHPNCKPYVESHILGKRIHLHRLITDCPDGMVVDHIDGNNYNIRKSNLSLVIQHLNTLNRNNTSHLRYDKRGRCYIVSVSIKGKTKYICYTRDIEEANRYAEQLNDDLKNLRIDKILNSKCKCISKIL